MANAIAQSHKKSAKEKCFLISSTELDRLRLRAHRAQQRDQSEVCGILIINKQRLLKLIFLTNFSDRPGHYEIKKLEVKHALGSVRLGWRPFGSFHSHPISEAIPGDGDKRGGFYRGIELIWDVCGRSGRLWRYYKSSSRDLKELQLKVIRKKRRRLTGGKTSRLEKRP